MKSIKLFSAIRSLLCGNLVYKAEKSRVEIEVAYPSLLSFFHCIDYWFIVLYYPKSINAYENLSSYDCVCLKNKEGLGDAITNLGDTIRNIASMGFLCILDIQYILGNVFYYFQ